MSFQRVPKTDRTNAALVWGITTLLAVGSVFLAFERSYLWAGLAAATAGLSILPAAAARRPTVVPPWGLPALGAVPLVVRQFGTDAGSEPLVQVATYVAVAALALVLAVDLNALTEVEMSRRFAVVFVVTTTMAVAGVWAVARGMSDIYLGTNLVRGSEALMWDLIVASATGVVGGELFRRWFHGAKHGGLRGEL